MSYGIFVGRVYVENVVYESDDTEQDNHTYSCLFYCVVENYVKSETHLLL
jgi:hypothetical protein